MKTNELALMARHFLAAHWRWHTLHGEALTRFQEQRAQQIIAYAAQYAPFYRAHWSGHDLHDWRHLPIVDKQLMMTHFDIFNTRGIKREEAMHVALQAEQSRDFRPVLAGLTVGLSSGTSGHRGLFLVSQEEQAGWAGTMLARALHDVRPRQLRVAFFLRSNSNLYEQIGGLLLQFRYFDLMLPLAEAISQLNAFAPDIIVGPPSLLGFLAQAQLYNQLRVRPQRLIAVAEVLEPQDKQELERVFHAPVHQIYQCTEGLLAISCKRSSLHIQEDMVVLQCEPLEEMTEDATMETGLRVTPIVTDLWRHTQPIIRYRLNDVLRLDTHSCSCGSSFRVIQAIEGRCDDVCYFESQAGSLRPFFPDTIRRMILLASPHISDYQVTQQHPGQLHVCLAVTSDTAFTRIAEQVRERVAEIINHYDCKPADVTIIEGLEGQKMGSKRRRVQYRR